MRKINFFLIFTILITVSAKNTFAQAGDAGLEELVDDTKSDLLAVVGGGLAGAILGLSTLSFVEEPKDHTKNIIVGAAIGIIAGVGFVAFSQASKSALMFDQEGVEASLRRKEESIKTFDTYARVDWHLDEVGFNTSIIVSPYQVGYNFRF